ncbi:ABC transporter ATP-binding protein/permease [Xylanimonas allomyrinae]|uniref:ABC transporter ATP-binding protein/permease n=2 Tax=Xylanimonas TaxID=186188 RepID=A0A4P6F5Q9_9MICO|nr:MULTISPECIES: ABC transporter ATP-binding protein/permease [Xylanimonas]QAY63228.1 ABC transporter ATP-binding protein/permease [Xylanimonas allomyrinae]QAY68645.1 ABC transporter ATP-binding protein/permease [Xylanimonas protaetiae]QAY69660.1 ABC transporter ATP-binding protein/permease [Xylanimonas protaetiae]QAY70726.1 ABC transporter ATP-binding protein/permease [Xylanimonas protaetiae]
MGEARGADLGEGCRQVRAVDQASEALIRLDGVTRRFGQDTVALDRVSLTIAPGETVAIVGRSGSGKSTLLNILGLLDAPDEGTVVVDGQPLTRTDDATRTAWRAAALGFVFQRSHLIGGLSVRENVALGLRYAATWDGDERSLTSRVDAALADVDLGHRADARASTLSGGEMQRAAIARTLVRGARLWLADEPTGNLDTTQSAEIIELLRLRARQHGAALVVVTHEPDIAALLDRVITLSDGRVVSDTGDRTGGARHEKVLASSGVVPERHAALPAGARTSRRIRRQVARTARFVRQGFAAGPGRTRAGMLAAALAVALTVTALGLSQSAATQVTAMFDARRASQVTATFTHDTGTPRWDLDIDSVRAFPGVTAAERWRQWDFIAMSNGEVAATDAQLNAVDATPASGSDARIRWATSADTHLRPGEVVLGKVLAERLGVTQLDLSPEITIAGQRLRVSGILTEARPGTAVGAAFVTPDTVSGLPPSYTTTVFALTEPGAASLLATRIGLLADPFEEHRLTVDPVLGADAYRGQLEASVSVALQVLAVVASLAGLAGVVLVNILSVTSRIPEFGLRRALGSRRGELVGLVVAECGVLGLLGAGLGFAVGFAAIMVVTAVARWQPVFDPKLALIPLAAVLVFSLAAASFPAVIAARTQPADAVRI